MSVKTWVAHDRTTRRCSACETLVEMRPLLVLSTGIGRVFICEDCLSHFQDEVLAGIRDVRAKLD